jgi:ribosomal protein L23
VKDVKVMVRKGKVRRFKRHESVGSLTKRAIITLKDSASFDKLAVSGAGGVQGEQMPSSASESK